VTRVRLPTSSSGFTNSFLLKETIFGSFHKRADHGEKGREEWGKKRKGEFLPEAIVGEPTGAQFDLERKAAIFGAYRPVALSVTRASFWVVVVFPRPKTTALFWRDSVAKMLVVTVTKVDFLPILENCRVLVPSWALLKPLNLIHFFPFCLDQG